MEIVTLSGHRAAVTMVRFIDGGASLVSGSNDTDVIMWDVVAEAGVVRLHGHSGPVTDCAHVSEHNLLLTCSKDHLLKLWDLETQHCVQTVVGHRAEMYAMALNDDETRLYTGTTDGELRVWAITAPGDPQTSEDATQEAEGVPICFTLLGNVVRQGKERVESLAIAPGGGVLGCQSADKMVEFFTLRTEEEIGKRLARRGKRLREKKKKKDAEAGDDEDEDGEASSAVDVDVDVARKLDDEIALAGTIRCTSKVRAFSFAPDDNGVQTNRTYKVAVTPSNNTVEAYKVSAGKKTIEAESITSLHLSGHRAPIRAIALSHDDTLILTTSNVGAKVWDRETQKCIRTLASGYGLCAAFVPGNRHVVIGTRHGQLQLFDLGSGDMIEEIEDAHESAIWTLDLQPDDQGFVTGSADHTVKFWEFELITDKSHSETSKRLSCAHVKTLKMTDDVMAVKFSPDQRYLAIALLDTTVKVFFADTLKFYLSLYGHKLPVLTIDISKDSTLILTGSADKNVKLWGLDFGDCHKSFFAHQDAVTSVKFVASTHHFFTTGKDHTIKQWDGDRFEQITTLEGHQAEVSGSVVSKNGTFMVSCSHDRSIRIWERTQELLNLDEEKEIAREADQERVEAEEEAAVARAQRAKGDDADLPGKRSTETLKAADRVLEAMELVELEAGKSKSEQPDLMLVAYGGITAEDYLLKVLNQVTSPELEQALLVLPFTYVMQMIPYLDNWIKKEQSVERCTRCLHLLLRIHMRQIVSNASLIPTFDSLRTSVYPAVSKLKDQIGFNLAGLRFLKQEIEVLGTHTFAQVQDVAENGAIKKKRKVLTS